MDTKTSIPKSNFSAITTVNIHKHFKVQHTGYALVRIGNSIAQVYLVLQS